MGRAASGPLVLLVEDEPFVAGVLQNMLSGLGHAVAGVTADIKEAIGILDRETIDAVVLDIELHGKMSYPIADELVTRGIPFIFASGYGSLPARYECYPFLRKPFRRSALGEALAGVLQQDRERLDQSSPAEHDQSGAVGRHSKESQPSPSTAALSTRLI